MDYEISVCVLGDVMCGRMFNKSECLQNDLSINKSSSSSNVSFNIISNDILNKLDESDVKLINLECAFSDSPPKITKQLYLHHQCDMDNIKILKTAGFSCCSLANNHILDCDKRGLIQTIKVLKENGIKYCGAGKNLHKAWKPAIITLPEKGNIKIAIFSIADHYREWASTEISPGICFFDIEKFVLLSGNPNTYMWNSLTFISEQIQSVRSKVDLVIVSIHWGPNFSWKPNEKFQEFAHHLIDFGVDVIHGHSSHHIQGIEIYNRRPIIYGCGDFLNDYDLFDSLVKEKQKKNFVWEFQNYKSHLSFIYQLHYMKSTHDFKISHIELTPIHISQGSVNRATGENWCWLKDKMMSLCIEFNTVVEVQENEKLLIRIDY